MRFFIIGALLLLGVVGCGGNASQLAQEDAKANECSVLSQDLLKKAWSCQSTQGAQLVVSINGCADAKSFQDSCTVPTAPMVGGNSSFTCAPNPSNPLFYCECPTGSCWSGTESKCVTNPANG